MAVNRWDPLREISALRERMNRLLADVRSWPPLREEDLVQGEWVPPVDIYETADSIVLKAEFPGMTREDISVEVKNHTLCLRGEKKFAKEVKEENYHRIERTYGSFHRTFTLPGTVQQAQVKAKFKDGVLEITLPKVEEAKPKPVEVE